MATNWIKVIVKDLQIPLIPQIPPLLYLTGTVGATMAAVSDNAMYSGRSAYALNHFKPWIIIKH